MDTFVNQDSTFSPDIKNQVLSAKVTGIQNFIELAKYMIRDDAKKGYLVTKYSLNLYLFNKVAEVEARNNRIDYFILAGLPQDLFESEKLRQYVITEFESQTGLKMTITPWNNPLLTLITCFMWQRCIKVKITQ